MASAGLRGLRCIILPDGLDAETALAIATTANAARSADDYSFVLADEGSDPTPGYLLPGDEVGFRTGDRLIVVPRRATTLVESVSGVYAQVLGPEFPATETLELGVGSIAESASALILGGTSPDETRLTLAGAISTAMRFLASAYELLGDEGIVWNAAWYRHCEVALDTLNDLVGRLDGHPMEDLLPAMYGSFCLPVPDNVRSDRPYASASRGPKDYKGRLQEGWFTADDVLSTVAFLPSAPDGGPHPLASLNWGGLPREIRAQRHPLLGLASLDRHENHFQEGWVALKESEFFGQRGDGSGSVIRFTDATGVPLPTLASASPVALMPPLVASGEGVMLSDTVRIRVPIIAGIERLTPLVVNVTKLRVITAPKSLRFIAGERFVDGDDLVIEGRLELRVSTTQPTRWPATKRVARLSVPLSDPIVGHIDMRASGSFFVLPDSMCVGLAIEVAGAKARAVHYVGSEYLDFDTGPVAAEDPISFPQAADNVTFVFPDTDAQYEGHDSEPLSAGWSRIHAPLMDGGVLRLGALEYRTELVAPELHIESPLLAAALKSRVSSDPSTARTTESVRGQYEQAMGSAILDGSPLPALGRWFLSSTETRQRIEGHHVAPGGGFLIDERFVDEWRLFDGPDLTPSVVNSREARALEEAFNALDLRGLLVEGTQGHQAPRTISRTSLAKLFGTPELDSYLTAYTDLVDLALRDGTGATTMWAAYPFSITVWKTTAAATLQTVLLSPFHPLRLHWLASTEHVLREASAAKAFLPVIEGWNYPAIGPGSGGGNTRVMAVPADNGDGQIFAGWSMLVRVSSEEPSALDIPARAGRYPLPGMSSSGLNEGGVRSAVRDFRRMNPWRSTVSLDLAATHPGPRLTEIDQAVVDEVSIWATDQNESLPGGLRVFDSMKRYGELPELGDVGRRLGAPLVWKRYEGDFSPEDVDLRLMQDSPASFRSMVVNEPEYAVSIGMPLRRYEVRGSGRTATRASRPQLGVGVVADGQGAFFGALASVEGGLTGGVTEIEARVNAKLLVAGGAEWTIIGEFNSDPTTLAAAIPPEDSADVMLWEWRPPFLQTGDTTSLERRAYVAFARIPQTFRDLLAAKIEEWSPEHAGSARQMAARVMSMLGVRGIGLSSLITTGGTRLTGAIGFYSCLELHSGASGEYILPIDICAPFITAISGKSVGEERRRADLLLIRLTDLGVELVPVEIKVRKEAVPAPTAAVLHDPLQQLADTTSSLRRLVEVWGHPEDAMSHKLRAVGLAALVETAISLSGDTDEAMAYTQRRRLAAVASGGAAVRLGTPLLAYLPIGADLGEEGELRDVPTTALVEGFGRHIQFLMDPIRLMADASGCPAKQTWQAAVDLAFRGTDVAGSSRHDYPVAPPPGAPSPDVTAEANGDDGEAGGDLETRVPKVELAGSGIRFPVGGFIDGVGEVEAEFWPSNTALNQLNVGVVGDLGTGKTQLLKALILGLRSSSEEAQGAPLPMLILDYKKDFQDPDFVDRVGARVIAPHEIPLNIFELHGGYSKAAAFKKARSFADTLKRIYAGVGPVQFNRLTKAITSLYQEMNPSVPTIHDIARAYQEMALKDDAVVSILDTFTLGEIFMHRGELVRFEDLLGDQVLVVDLHGLGADQSSKHALVAFFLDLYYEYMYSRPKRPYVGDDPQLRWLSSYLLVDEASNILHYEFDSLKQILLAGREFGVGVMLSTQFLSHFKTTHENWAEPLRTWFIHRVPGLKEGDLRRIGATLSPDDKARRIGDLKIHEALYVGLEVDGRLIRGYPYWQLIKTE